MNQILTFDIDALARVALHAASAPEHTFGYDVLYEPEYHKGGVVREKEGSPDADNIDASKVTPALILVKDQGVYFMSNGKPQLPIDKERYSHVVYAHECNPNTRPDWYETSREIMGGDDTVITLFGWPEAVLEAKKAGAIAIQVLVSPNALELEPVMPKGAGVRSVRH